MTFDFDPAVSADRRSRVETAIRAAIYDAILNDLEPDVWIEMLERIPALPPDALAELEMWLAETRPEEIDRWTRMALDPSISDHQLWEEGQRIAAQRRERRAACDTATLRRSAARPRAAIRPLARRREHRSTRHAAARRDASSAGSDPGDPEPAGIDGGAR